MDTQQVLEQIFSKKTVFLANRNEEVSLHKITVRTLRPVIDLLAKAMGDLKLGGESLPTQALGSDPALILKLISLHYEDTVAVASQLSSLDLATVYELEADDALVLVQSIIVLNQDFFTKKVLPTLGLSQAVRAAVPANE